jgi:hypothetical protein
MFPVWKQLHLRSKGDFIPESNCLVFVVVFVVLVEFFFAIKQTVNIFDYIYVDACG